MFMVDDSGSTATTDRNFHYRAETIQTFLQKYGSKKNFSYSFGKFSGTTATIYDVSIGSFKSSPIQGFGGPTDLLNALHLFTSKVPSGNTPYGAAFTSLENAIDTDERNGFKQNYAVIFMSDGMPTDLSGSVLQQIDSLVSGLRAHVSANGTSVLTLSSVYFGSEDANAIGNLQHMAAQGKGQFIDTNKLTGADLNIDDVLVIPCPTPSPSATPSPYYPAP